MFEMYLCIIDLCQLLNLPFGRVRRRLVRCACQILTALEYVHSLRLIHCDLKPARASVASTEPLAPLSRTPSVRRAERTAWAPTAFRNGAGVARQFGVLVASCGQFGPLFES